MASTGTAAGTATAGSCRGTGGTQPYPSEGVVRPIWIADHIKGPDGAPLLATTKVNVWCR